MGRSLHGLSMLDLRKAFDLVDHQILLEKGRIIRPRYDSGSLVSIESCLSDRYFQVKIGKVLSSKTALQYDLESPGINTRPPYIYNTYERSSASPE